MSFPNSSAGPFTRESMFRQRVNVALGQLGVQFPSMLRKADFVRQDLISRDPDQYPDKQPFVWVRLWEQMPIFFFEKMDRFWQPEAGVINQKALYVLCPDNLGIRPDDIMLISGDSYKITEMQEGMGICKLKVEREKSNWVAPSRSTPTYRVLSMRAVIL